MRGFFREFRREKVSELPKNLFFLFSKRFVIYNIINIVLLAVLTRYKVSFIENVRFTDCASWIRLPDCSKLAINQKNNNDVTVCQHNVIFKFFSRLLFLLSILVTGPNFTSISSLVLELWQFYFTRVDKKSGNWKHPCLSFAQYLETGAS